MRHHGDHFDVVLSRGNVLGFKGVMSHYVIMHNYNMYSVINHVVNLYGLKAISIHSCCTFNMSMGVMCVLQSWVLPRYCIKLN